MSYDEEDIHTKPSIIISGEDKELFLMFKDICDRGLPELNEQQQFIIRNLLWSKKRKIRYRTQLSEHVYRIYIDFPRMSVWHYIKSYIRYFILVLRREEPEV